MTTKKLISGRQSRSVMLSKKCRYAIVALCFMAGNERISVQVCQVAELKNIPKNLLKA